MRLIEAEKAKDVIHEYFKSLMINGASGTDVDRLAVGIGSCLRHDANLLKAIDELPSVQPERKTARWIPVTERLPEGVIGGLSNWHTDDCIVCVYGNACYEGWENFGYEILTGNFIEFEDEETGEKELCFEPDRHALFLPDDWELMPLDKEFKSHLDKDECTYYVDDSCTTTEFHDRYFQILAWMPLPEPYKENPTC